MIEILITFVLEVAKCLAPPLGRRFDHLRNYEINFENLHRQLGELRLANDRVHRKVNDAVNNVEEIEPEVKEWQINVGSILDEAEKLIEDKANNRCCKGLCPNLMTRHKNSKEASTKVKVIDGLLQKEERFEKVSHLIIPEDRRLTSTNDYEAFESRKDTSKNILNALNDANVHMIGIHGMGGIGKTTLAKEVGRQAIKEKLFDQVVFVEISENPQIKTIQEEIAGKLGLSFKEETERDRASKLFVRLMNEKNILLILDNIWKDLDLEDVGIPSGDDHRGLKLLLTSRDRHLLVTMGASSLFPIDSLSVDEAWKLFKKIAGDDIENEELGPLSEEVAKQCGGLPIAIVTVAKALKGKRHHSQWREALRQLSRPSPTNFEADYAKAYSSIKLSYDYLRDELKKVFLLCSSIRTYASQTSISDLLKYVMGLDIFQGIYTMREARDKLCSLIEDLKDFSLLLDGRNNEWFSMHDFVREVAVSIAKGDEHLFYVRNETNWELPCPDTQKNCKKIFLLDIDTGELPTGELECPQLESLCMMRKLDWQLYYRSRIKIHETFFVGMVKLKVLDLDGMHLFSLKSSLHALVNLQTLCLHDGEIEDVVVIGELKKLKILSLRSSNIKQLPAEIGKLTQLRLLDLSYSWQLEVIASNVISSLSRLEELYMRGCRHVKWEDKGLNVESGNACLEELCYSSQLTTLEIDIEDEKVLPKELLSKKLERYNISIGSFSLLDVYNLPESSRMLKLKLNSSLCLKELQNIKIAQVLHLEGSSGDKDDVLSELDIEGFSQLKHLRCKNNHQFRCIVDSTNLVARDAFPALESLYLSNLSNLEKIFCGQYRTKSFGQLREVTLEDLPQLTSFYSRTSENNQEELTSSGAPSEEIVLENRFGIPKSLFNEKVVFPKLEVLEQRDMSVENIWDSQPTTMSSPYKNLTRLMVNKCQKLKSVFSSYMIKSLEQLQHLEISKCNVLKEIVAEGGDAEAATCKFIFPQVTFLKFQDLPELTTFYNGVHTSEWPMLNKLEIGYCDKVNVFSYENSEESLVDVSRPQSLFLAQKINPNLEELILHGKNITLMWQSQLAKNHFSKLKVTMCVDNDESTNMALGIRLKLAKNLETLQLHDCSYKEIFSFGENEIYDGTPFQIKVLEMERLSNLKYMWKQDSKLDSLLQNLEILKVEHCPKLMNVVPSSASFQNLTTLEVFACGGLVNLITSSTAKSLEQLREMKIENCDLLIEVVANEEDVVKDEIVFKKLKLLSLRYLPSLISFYYGNHTFIFPSLEELIVDECPNMKNFSGGVLIAPKLQKVRLSEWDKKECWEGDLNTTIQELHKEKVNSNSEKLTLSGDDVRMAWQGQFPEHYCCELIKVLDVIKDESANIPLRILERFSNLEILILKACSYKEIFSSERALKHAETLTQIRTLELRGIFYLKQMWQQDSQLDSVLQNLEILNVRYCHSLINLVPNSASFENLTTLAVWSCDGLRNLITSSTARSLIRLKRMTIGCCELSIEVVENREDEAKEDEIVFNNLKELYFEHLESLSSFCSGNYSFNFPALEELTVKKCPGMKVFSKGVLSTPKLQKVKQYWNDLEGCWEGDLNTTIQQLYKRRNGESCEKDLGEPSTQPLSL